METIITKSTDVLSKELSIKNLSILIVILFACVLMITAATKMELEATSPIYLLLMTVGGVGAIVSLIKIAAGTKRVVYHPTGSPIKSYNIFFKPTEISSLTKAIETGDTSKMHSMLNDTNSGIRLDVVMAKDGKFAACQLFQYVPYSYEPATDVYRIDESFLANFCKEIKVLAAYK